MSSSADSIRSVLDPRVPPCPPRLKTGARDLFGRQIRVGDFVVAFNEYKSYRGTLYWVVSMGDYMLSLVGTTMARAYNNVGAPGGFHGSTPILPYVVGWVKELRGLPYRSITRDQYYYDFIRRGGGMGSPKRSFLDGLHRNTKYPFQVLVVNDLLDNLPEDMDNPPGLETKPIEVEIEEAINATMV